jgi:hypothetical protein
MSALVAESPTTVVTSSSVNPSSDDLLTSGAEMKKLGIDACGTTTDDTPVASVKDAQQQEPYLEWGRESAATAVQIMRIFQGIDEEKDTLCTGIKWSKPTERDGIVSRSTAVDGCKWNCVTACTKVAGSKDDIFSFLNDDNNIASFDEFFDKITHSWTVSDMIRIRRVCCKAVWPTTPRDLLMCTTSSTEVDGSLMICSRFVPDELFDKVKGYVRATMLISGYRIQPCHTLSPSDPYHDATDCGSCKVTLICHTDLGGTLPAVVLNLVSQEGPLKTLGKIRRCMANRQEAKKAKKGSDGTSGAATSSSAPAPAPAPATATATATASSTSPPATAQTTSTT